METTSAQLPHSGIRWAGRPFGNVQTARFVVQLKGPLSDVLGQATFGPGYEDRGLKAGGLNARGLKAGGGRKPVAGAIGGVSNPWWFQPFLLGSWVSRFTLVGQPFHFVARLSYVIILRKRFWRSGNDC